MWPKFSLFLLELIRMQRNGARCGSAWNVRSADSAVSTGRAINNSLTVKFFNDCCRADSPINVRRTSGRPEGCVISVLVRLHCTRWQWRPIKVFGFRGQRVAVNPAFRSGSVPDASTLNWNGQVWNGVCRHPGWETWKLNILTFWRLTTHIWVVPHR